MTLIAGCRYHARPMSSGRLPILIDPIALAGKQQQLQGTYVQSELTRVKNAVADDASGVVSFQLLFQKRRKAVVITGRVQSELQLKCQCCMQLMRWPINNDISLGVVASMDEADLLPESHEPVLLTEETLSLKDLVEEELLLALPVVPQHEGQCPVKGATSEVKKVVETSPDADDERYKPFANLSELIKTGE